MTLSKKAIREVEEKFSFATEDNYLKLILQSYDLYNHRARLDIAKILFEHFKSLPKTEPSFNDLKINLFAEVYAKLIQSLEDAALFAMMFIGVKWQPLTIFSKNETRDFYTFFKKAKRGFSDRQILRLYGLAPAEELVSKGLISSFVLAEFKDTLAKLVDDDKKRWRGLGNVYAQTGSKKTGLKKPGAISTFHNIKHGYKVLSKTELYKKFWPSTEDSLELSVIESYKPWSELKSRIPYQLTALKSTKLVTIGTFEVTERTIEEIFERIHPSEQLIQMYVDMNLGNLDDKSYSVREIRYAIFRQKNPGKSPKHFELCPCGSGVKFKKCHSNKDYSKIDALIYDPN